MSFSRGWLCRFPGAGGLQVGRFLWLAVTGLAGVARGCCSRFRLGCLALDSGAERAGTVSTWFWLVVFCAGRFLWLAVGTFRRVAWFGAVLVWLSVLDVVAVPGVVGLRAVGSLPVPRRGLIAGVRVILVWLLVGGWLVGVRGNWVLGGGALRVGCSMVGSLLCGRLLVVAFRLRWLAVFPVWWWGCVFSVGCSSAGGGWLLVV